MIPISKASLFFYCVGSEVCYDVSEESAASIFRVTKLGWMLNCLWGGNVSVIQEGCAGFFFFFFWKRGQTLHGANANWQKLNKRHKNASSHILTSGSKVEGQVAYIRSSLFGRTSRSLYRVLILSDNCALSLPAVTPTWTGSGTQ